MTIGPVTYISLNLSPEVGADDSLVGVRVVPAGRQGSRLYGRTLNQGEPDTGQGISIEPGEILTFPAGSISVTMADVDRNTKPGPDGYAPVANTVWSWLAIPPPPLETDHTFVNYLFAAARRLDAAHKHCAAALAFLTSPPRGAGFPAREAIFDALGHAESMCIALNRAVRMITQAQSTIATSLPVPQDVTAVEQPVVAIRNAFEHIDERAVGKARHENSIDAVSAFDQTDFFNSGILRYANHSLDLKSEVVPALIAGRQYIIEVATSAGPTKTLNEPVEWAFTKDPRV